ncbi:FimH-like protein [hydrothermal vent metagenome]|uniref:FimH-like protein n=1 Tax=hydrothermal vent metagenome TaxID=652676 RepID=A0A1W1D064_9ZZZZ
MKKTGLIIATLLTFSQAEFTRAESGIVTDSQTQLQWQDLYADNNVPRNYGDDAIDYCSSLDLDGTGWRLPNINELKSLLVDTQFAPSINEVFQSTVNDWYWSSSTRKIDSDYRWVVNFNSGAVSIRPRINNNYTSYIRCVR